MLKDGKNLFLGVKAPDVGGMNVQLKERLLIFVPIFFLLLKYAKQSGNCVFLSGGEKKKIKELLH